MITKYEKANRGKLLAAVMIMAVIVAGAAVAFSDSEVNADVQTTTGSATEYTAGGELSGNAYYVPTDATIALSADGKTFYIPAGVTVTFTGSNSATVMAATAFDEGTVTYIQNLSVSVTASTDGAGVTNNNGDLTTETNDESATAGITVFDSSAKNYTYYGNGAVVSNISIDNTDTVTVKNGTATVSQGTNTITVASGETGLTTAYIISAAEGYPTIAGGDSGKGTVTVTSGVFMESTTVNALTKNYVCTTVDSTTYYSAEIVSSLYSESSNAATVFVEGEVTQRTDVASVTNAPSVTINGTYTITEGTTVDVGNISGKGTINLYGNLVSTTSNNNDTILNVASGATYTGTFAKDKVNYLGGQDEYQFGNRLDQSETVNSSRFLSSNLVIPADMSLTIGSNGSLNLSGFSILVEGELIIEANGTISGIGVDGESIILSKNGSITNNGIIGNGQPVEVTAVVDDISNFNGVSEPTYDGVGSVSVQNVTGISFGLKNTGTDDNPERTLTVTGDLAATGSSNNTVTLDGVIITGDLTVGDGVELKIETSKTATISKDATLTVNGALANDGTLTMDVGSTVVVIGEATGSVTAKVGTYETRDTTMAGLADNAFKFSAKVSGIEITVTSQEKMDNSSGTNVSKTTVRMEISGTLAENEDALGELTIGTDKQSYYVAEGDVLAVPEGITVKGTVYVLGEVQMDNSSAVSYVGTSYTVTNPDKKTEVTTYVKPFDAAFKDIEKADKMTLTVREPVEIDDILDIKAGYTIKLTSGNNFDVGEKGEVSVQKGATVTGKINDVQGLLTIYDGAGCSAPNSYAVKKTGDGYTSYAGLVAAINNAVAGDVIDVRYSTPIKSSMDIPAGVTVNIADGVTLTFSENLTVEETAKVVNNGTIFMIGEKSRVTVNGTLDSADRIVEFASSVKEGQFNSTGTSIGAVTVTGTASVNAATYTNDDGETVYTTVASAVAAAAAKDTGRTVQINGTLTETGDISLEGLTSMTIASGAKVTLGNVTVADCYIDATNAEEFTASVSGETGADGSTAAASVSLNKVSGVVVGNSSYTNAENVKNWYTYIYGTVDGAVTVSSGNVYVGTDAIADATKLIVDGKDNSLTVASGATLTVADINGTDMTLDAGKNDTKASVVIDGSIVIDGGVLDLSAGQMDVNGTMTVADDNDVEITGTLNVAGTLDISTTADKEASVTVTSTGVIAIGSAPTTLGASGTVSGQVVIGNYVKAYGGSDVTNAKFVDASGTEYQPTAFYINGTLYMTAYGSADYSDVVSNEAFDVVGYKTSGAKTIGNWYTDADYTDAATDAALGTDSALYINAESETANIQVSVGSQISLYVDGIKVTGNMLDPSLATIGTHQVTATVNPGYTGDVTITFNGQTVNGTFEITPDMVKTGAGTLVLSATGNISVDMGSTGSSDDGGMGIVEILLIILVIVVVILAIFVVLRMMRS